MTELEKEANRFIVEEVKVLVQADARDVRNAFIAGSEWQAKQSPWISVEDRLPEKDGLRVWVKSSCLNHQPLVYHQGKFYARLSDGAYDGSVTHWIPIPE